MRRLTQHFQDIIADPDINFGLDPSWCSLYPYQMLIKPGESAQAEVRVQNYKKAPMKMEISLIAPGEWRIEPDVLRFEAACRRQDAPVVQDPDPARLDAKVAPLRPGG